MIKITIYDDGATKIYCKCGAIHYFPRARYGLVCGCGIKYDEDGAWFPCEDLKIESMVRGQ